MHGSSLIGGALGVLCGTGLVLLNRPHKPGPDALRALMPPVDRAISPAAAAQPTAALEREQIEAPSIDARSLGTLTVDQVRTRYASATAGERFHMLLGLADSGDPDAINLLLEIVENDPDSVGGSPSIWRLLQKVEDPRVYPLAKGRLESLLERGLRGPHISGYLNLVAWHGGREGAEILLAHIQDAAGGISGEAARAVAVIRDESMAQEYLHMVTDPRIRDRGRVASGLAAWRDPAVTRELIALGRKRDLPWELRARTLENVGRYAADDALVLDVLESYWSAEGDEHECRVAFAGLQGLWQNHTADRAFVADRVAEVLVDSLGSDQWSHAVVFVTGCKDWQTPQTLGSMWDLLATLTNPDDREFLEARLAEMTQ